MGTVSTQKPFPGWLATLSRTANPDDNIALDTFAYVRMKSRHLDRQISGLLHFAKELHWPNIETLAWIAKNQIEIFDNLNESVEAGGVFSASTQQTNTYSMTYATTGSGLSKCPRATAVFHTSGWVCNSYISGLMLPGEGLSHFIMCTLLNNDITALCNLGSEASLYSGFCYGGRSFWSTSCVVGRVLAAGKGASECVGWISSDIVPQGLGNTWVDINVSPVPVLGRLLHFFPDFSSACPFLFRVYYIFKRWCIASYLLTTVD